MIYAENNRVELKERLSDDLEKEAVAFLNYKEGGTIYIGIDKNGKVVGVDKPDKIQLQIKDRLITAISPSIMGLFDIICEEIEGKSVIKVVLASGSEMPYYIKKKGMSESGCFVRIGSSAQPMTTSVIEDLFTKRLKKSIANIESNRQDLTFGQLKIYYEARGIILKQNFAKTLDLVTTFGTFNYAAKLLADENSSSIRLAKYAGMNKVDLKENEEYGYCSIIKAMQSVIDKLELENVTRTEITPSQRIDKPLVDKIALREIIINAFVHNDYSTEDTPLFEIFSDRFVITSHGGLVEGLSKKEFLSGISKPRNRELMRIFKDLGYVEHLGSGMDRILQKYEPSIFEFTEHFLRTILKFEISKTDIETSKTDIETSKTDIETSKTDIETSKTDIEISEKEDKTSKKILECIIENPKITSSMLATKLDISKSATDKQLANLKKLGKIRRVGSTKAGSWDIL